MGTEQDEVNRAVGHLGSNVAEDIRMLHPACVVTPHARARSLTTEVFMARDRNRLSMLIRSASPLIRM